MEHTVTPLIYHNVMLLMHAHTEREQANIVIYEHNVKYEGTSFNLRLFSSWCRSHNITYSSKFFWLKSYPFTANIWNLLTYLLWKIENLTISLNQRIEKRHPL